MVDVLLNLGVHAMRALTMHLLLEPVNNTVRALVEQEEVKIPIDTQNKEENRLQYVVRKYTSPIPSSTISRVDVTKGTLRCKVIKPTKTYINGEGYIYPLKRCDNPANGNGENWFCADCQQRRKDVQRFMTDGTIIGNSKGENIQIAGVNGVSNWRCDEVVSGLQQALDLGHAFRLAIMMKPEQEYMIDGVVRKVPVLEEYFMILTATRRKRDERYKKRHGVSPVQLLLPRTGPKRYKLDPESYKLEMEIKNLENVGARYPLDYNQSVSRSLSYNQSVSRSLRMELEKEEMKYHIKF